MNKVVLTVVLLLNGASAWAASGHIFGSIYYRAGEGKHAGLGEAINLYRDGETQSTNVCLKKISADLKQKMKDPEIQDLCGKYIKVNGNDCEIGVEIFPFENSWLHKNAIEEHYFIRSVNIDDPLKSPRSVSIAKRTIGADWPSALNANSCDVSRADLVQMLHLYTDDKYAKYEKNTAARELEECNQTYGSIRLDLNNVVGDLVEHLPMNWFQDVEKKIMIEKVNDRAKFKSLAECQAANAHLTDELATITAARARVTDPKFVPSSVGTATEEEESTSGGVRKAN
ncbi:MAG: hypothetical protein ACXWR1_08205 [Bdellovibrionota bacterium]